MFYFSEDVSARADFWIVGDEFLRAMLSVFQALKTEASFNNQPLPYIYSYYNVSSYFESPLSKTKSVAARLLNSIIEGMNTWAHLPRYILIVPDMDVIDYICKSNYIFFDQKPNFEPIMSWLVKEIKKAIEIRLDDLHHKCLGTILTSVEPRLIWVKVVPRPPHLCKEEYSFITQFNSFVLTALLFKWG